MQGPIDLSQLPAPKVVEELDYETILSERKAALLDEFPQAAAVLELESEPLTKLLQENAYREVLWRQRVNEAAMGVMLAFARESDLDQLAANLYEQRLVIQEGDADANPPVPEILESDEDFRMRAQNAFEGLSVAGPSAAYIKHARAADGRIASVTAISPEPCEALITVLSREGDGVAPQDMLDAVEAALSPDDIRPIGDRVTVQSAVIQTYTVEATLYLPPGPESAPVLAQAEAALDDYISNKSLGRNIRRTAIIAALHVPGVSFVELTAPASDLVLDDTQAGHCTGITLTTVVDNAG